MAVELVKKHQEGLVEVDSYGTSAQEMAVRLGEMKQRVSLVQTFFKEVMVQDQDYGIIPGTHKPTLLKPGAEKFCEFYGYSIHVITEREEKCRDTGFYDCAIKVQLVSRRTGQLIAEGVGEANTYESRYRYRWVWPNQVPSSIDRNGLVTRETRSGKIQYRLENDDLFSLWNTVKKMAKKRALVDATLSATRSSGLFTQDMEDLRDWVVEAETIEEPEEPAGSSRRNNAKSHSVTSPTDITSLRKQFFVASNNIGVPTELAKDWAKDAYGRQGVPLNSFNDITAQQLAAAVRAMGTNKGSAGFAQAVTDWYCKYLLKMATDYCGDEEQAHTWMKASLNKAPEEAGIVDLQAFARELARATEPSIDGEESGESPKPDGIPF